MDLIFLFSCNTNSYVGRNVEAIRVAEFLFPAVCFVSLPVSFCILYYYICAHEYIHFNVCRRSSASKVYMLHICTAECVAGGRS